MILKEHYGAHSALVEMRLVVNGTSLGITHMGPDYVLLAAPSDHPPGKASIVLKVDESESRWEVRLPQGISGSSRRVVLALSE